MEKRSVACPNVECGTRLRVKPDRLGKKVRCPKCGTAFTAAEIPDDGTPAEDWTTTPAQLPAAETGPAEGIASPQTAGSASETTGKQTSQAEVQPPDGPEAGRPRAFHRERSWIERIVAGRQRWRTAMRWTLAASALMHLSLVPLAPKNSHLSEEELARYDSEYQRKIEATKNAAVLARTVQRKIRNPPPPPDPESVIQDTMEQALAGDIEKVVGDILKVDVTKEITGKVKASLRDELSQMAKDIAENKLTEEEIKKLHSQFREKAHQQAVHSLNEYRERTQVEHATLTTTEWYEKEVSPALFGNLSFFLFTPPNYKGWPPSPNAFYDGFTGSFWGSRYPAWIWEKGRHPWYPGFTYANMSHKVKYGLERDILEGHVRVKDPKTNKEKDAVRECYPGPNVDQARFIAERLNTLFETLLDDRGKVARDGHGWKDLVYGGPYHLGAMTELHPHEEDAFRAKAEAVDKKWSEAIAAAETYQETAESGASPDELKKSQKAAFEAVRELGKAIPTVWLGKEELHTRETVNHYTRMEVLHSPLREKMYDKFVEKLVAELTPVIKDYVREQFRGGIRKHKDGVDQAIKEFPSTVLPLLKRDVGKLIAKNKFNAAILAPYSHKSKVTGREAPPDDEQLAADRLACDKVLSERPDLRGFYEKRKAIHERQFGLAIDNVIETIMQEVLTGKYGLTKAQTAFVEGADYADPALEKLTSREHALKGRGQDLANLTKEGTPDTSAPLIALQKGGGLGRGASLQAVVAAQNPAYINFSLPETALKASGVVLAPKPSKWGFETQVAVDEIQPAYQSPKFEAIPFLVKSPNLDGDLSDWGAIRPLLLKGTKGEEIWLRAGWNYQGFFFAYDVKQPDEEFFYPSQYKTDDKVLSYSVGSRAIQKQEGVDWAFAGDYLHLMFDTLDARHEKRGLPHTQEFIVFPRGTDTDPDRPGLERIIASQRDATEKRHRRIIDESRFFNQQPGLDAGPDGSGPYRVTRPRRSGSREEQGYSTEVFLPRTIFNVKVFAPGWTIGFNASVQRGSRGLSRSASWISDYKGRVDADKPNGWGDVLMLGTDPYVVVQNADDGAFSRSEAIIPGHSYLLSVVDPDRNVSLAAEDTVLVSAEASGEHGDVEIFILRETAKNSGIFQGYIDTQPGKGREIHGVLEAMPGQEVNLQYVDFADSRGRRNGITRVSLPVIASFLAVGGQRR